MICCVTGHRPQGFPFARENDQDIFKKYLEKLLDEVGLLIWKGYDLFLTGMAEGADIDFAYSVLEYQNIYPQIRLEAALSYPYQAPKRKTLYIQDKETVLQQCSQVHVISSAYHEGCMQQRNQYMVDHADLVFAIWNGSQKGGTWNTIRYAQRIGKPIRYLLLNDLDAWNI